ncbi:MAG: nucleotidyltransferase family protein [Chromatiales bacterium]|nr:MAG: nucleotidyltransferase family protein [Chromatiales bacterium]
MDYSAILLAGERTPDGAVARAAGVPCKALAQVGGQPMLERVLATLAQVGRFTQCRVVGNPEFRNALNPVLAGFPGFAHWQDGDGSPARSAALAAAAIPADQGILLTTADHPLLTPAMVAELLATGDGPTGDVTAGLVRHSDVMASYPTARCTALRFAGEAYCGTNLFLFRTARGRRLMTEWQRVEQARKTPWRVVGILGPVAVAGYLTGLLSLPRALRLLSKRTQLAIDTRLLSDARAALDVDTVGDLEFARTLLPAQPASQA